MSGSLVDLVSDAVVNDEVGRVVETARRWTGALLTSGENTEGVDDLGGTLVESREVVCCVCELDGRQVSADTALERAELFAIGLDSGILLVGAVGPVDG